MSFKSNGYQIIRKVISKELSDFICDYFLLKRKVARKFFDDKRILPWVKEWGTWTDPQVPNTYSHYADIAMETLLEKVQPVMEEKSGVKLVPTYSYARIYKHGDILHRHKDRSSCEISTTINLGGEPWSIFLEGMQIDLEPGDMLMYRGCELEHWRDAFEGENCVQVFLHYNDASNPNSRNTIYDSRPFLGLPNLYRKPNIDTIPKKMYTK
jgi:hypothetical protein|tara:strand:- start:85 stop:717 length:633 start_codon:yes stop_codon:yes gene_type:complete